jgi:hypothetical protein
VAQTDGEPLPEAAEASGDPGTKTAALRSAILDRGIAIEAADDLGGAIGTATTGRIQILNGLSPAETFVVLAHEYAHLCSAVGYVWLRQLRSDRVKVDVLLRVAVQQACAEQEDIQLVVMLLD